MEDQMVVADLRYRLSWWNWESSRSASDDLELSGAPANTRVEEEQLKLR
jgi:hypothetical protein